LERFVGTLFALTLFGFHGKAHAENLPSRTKGERAVHESRAKTVVKETTVLPGVEQTLRRLEQIPSKLLRLADEDGDAHVSLTEFESLVQKHVLLQVRARFSRLDRNRDGRVTKTEVPRMDPRRFERFDANRDGAFTASELAVVMRGQVTRRCTSLLARYDADGDGFLTAADTVQSERPRVTQLATSPGSDIAGE